jgi:flavodoxin
MGFGLGDPWLVGTISVAWNLWSQGYATRSLVRVDRAMVWGYTIGEVRDVRSSARVPRIGQEVNDVKGLVVYDSKFGNTEKVAHAIAAALGPGESVRAVKVDAVAADDLKDLDVVVVGSPVHAWHPTKEMQAFLDGLQPNALSGVRAAAFDTRLRGRLAGAAADNIEKTLRKQGCTIVAPSTGFLVLGKEGPLAEGELDKAAIWAKQILEAIGANP